jgi:Putative esterase
VGLTSGALALVLGLAVAAALVGVLLGWRRLGRPGARRVAARAVALFALQVGVLALVFVLANRSLVFYSSWSDLLGSDSAGAAVRPAHAGRATAADTVQVLAESAVAVAGVPGAAGRLAAIRIHGELSGLTVQGQLYLPPGDVQPAGSSLSAGSSSPAGPGQPAGSTPPAGPGRAASGAGLYPVIIAFTGQPASGGSPYAAQNLAAAAAAQIAAGRLPPVILLILPAGPARAAPARAGPGPGNGGRPGSEQAGPGCLDVPGGVQGQTFLTQDIPRILQGRYRAAAPGTWALLGDRAGGYCSLELALSDSATFAVAAVPRGRYDSPPATQAGGSPQIRDQENLLWQLRNQPAQPVSVLFAGPGASAGLGRDARFAALARPPMRVTSTGLARGRFPLAPVLDWLGAAMRLSALESRDSAGPAGTPAATEARGPTEARSSARAAQSGEPPMPGCASDRASEGTASDGTAS